MNKQGKDGIDWCDASWGIITGCSRLCTYCYAARMAHRFKRSFEPTYHPERLHEPLKLKKPSRIFACSAGEMFDPAISFDINADIWGEMWGVKRHTFIVLTKCADRMREFYDRWDEWFGPGMRNFRMASNIWLGVSLTGDVDHERAWQLLETPAAMRFISYEPMLAPLDLNKWELLCSTWRKGATIGTYLDWIIVGAMSGPGALPPKREWVESIVSQCQSDKVPLFMKRNLAPFWEGDLIQQYPEAQS